MIGPLLFLILIGDIDDHIAHAFLSSFADDTRLTAKFRGVSEAILLQSDLESVYQWAEDNNADLNNKKFEAVRLGTNDALKLTTSYAAPDGTLITEKEDLRDLDVSSFKRYIENMCQSAKNMCSWVLRTL